MFAEASHTDLDFEASELLVAEHKDRATAAVSVEPCEAAGTDLVAVVGCPEASHTDHEDRELVVSSVASSSVSETLNQKVVLASSAF